MNIRTRNIIAACMLSLAVSSHASYIWWEGEDAVTNNFPRRSGFSPMNEAERAVLSEGAWLSIDGTRAEPAFAEYTVAVPAAGTYDLWVRKFWKHGPFRWRFGKGEWREVGRDVALADSVTLRPLVGANWVRCGAVKLDAGTQVFRIELTENTGAACFDCFILSPVPFTPRGKLKPDEKYGQAPEGWFTFEPGRDTFENAVLDLRGLNEREAGSQGAVFRRGDQFVFEKTGAPVAFWGVTACQNVWMMDKDDVDYLARRLAKMGVNMVRLHTSPFDESTPGPVTRKIHYLVSALKKQGIYVGINWYCLACVHVKPAWDLPELPNGYQPMSALFCYPRLQERYKAWARALFASTNEYTGMTLATDPAVAFIELIDEDNYFFWTFAPKQFPEPVRAALETQFGDWLAKRYGSIQKAKEYWGPGPAPEGAKDDPASGRMTLYPASIMTGADWAVASRNARRMRDQVEFLVASQRGFFAMMRDWLRKDLGYRSCVVPTNWKTADERVLGPLDKYTYLAGDATARNCYFSGPFKEQNGAFGFGPGDAYADRSVLNAPESAIMLEMQYADYPHVATEGGWAMPNRYRSEGPLVMAAYGALQGTDGFCPFVVEHDWVNTLPMWP
ncbi:glycoside hydrolase family 5 protein, partial [bacterium]|nr:glycoside hydrolase family 5 protein [bacterium]